MTERMWAQVAKIVVGVLISTGSVIAAGITGSSLFVITSMLGGGLFGNGAITLYLDRQYGEGG